MVYWVYLFSKTKLSWICWLLPSNSKGLHGVLGVSVLEHEALLDLLVDPLKLLKVGLELINSLFILPQPAQLLLKAALHAHANSGDGVHLPLDPGSHLVGLLSELPPQGLVVLLLLRLVLQGLVPLRDESLHLIPLALNILAGQVSVWVDGGAGDVILLGKLLTVVDEGDDRGEFLVRLTKGGLELRMRVNQALDLLKSVDNEHVDQVLAGSVQPVVEGSGALGELQVERVHALQNLFGLIHALPALLGECAKAIPLVTNGLASAIHLSRLPVVQSVELLGNGSNLLDAVLVGGQVGFESFVLLLHRLQLEDLAVLVVLRAEHLLLARSPCQDKKRIPCLVDVSLVLELLGQVLKPLKAHKLGQQPLLESLLTGEETEPGALDVGDQLALSWHVGRPVGEPQLGLEGVEVGLQLRLLFHPGRLVLPPVLPVLLQLLLDRNKRVAALSGFEPWQGPPDPLKEVTGEPLVFFHQPLVVLVHLQHLADPVGGHLSLLGSLEGVVVA